MVSNAMIIIDELDSWGGKRERRGEMPLLSVL